MNNEDLLTTLGKKHGTDKADGHIYTKIYDNLFSKIRKNKINLLEIGSGDLGSSHFMWKEYFENAEIYCIDPFHQVGDNQKSNLVELLEDAGIHVFKGNQLSNDDLESFIQKHKVKFDIIIDDAAHMPDAIQNSLGYLFPYLNSGGLYIVEDLVTAKDRQNKIDIVNKNIEGILDIKHKIDINLEESLLSLQENKKWLSNILNEDQKEYLEKNIAAFQFFNDYVGPKNLCIIQKV